MIRACAGPPGGEYRWLPLQSEVAEYEPGQDLEGSSVRVRLKKGGNFWATCEYTATIDGEECAPKWEQFAGAVVHSVKLESVEFSGGHTVLRDDGTAYPSPAWKDGNLDGDVDDEGDHSSPIAFTRNTPWCVQAAIVKLDPPDVDVGTVSLRMTSQGKPPIETESIPIPGGLQFSSDLSPTNLPNTVDYHAALPITWKLDFGCDGKPNTKSFTTRHEYYVTLNNPSALVANELLVSYYYIACRACIGTADEASLFSKLWEGFKAPEITNGSSDL